MDLVAFSHLRWNFVYQRPQHLLSRFVKYHRVFYFEESVFTDQEDGYNISMSAANVWVVVPNLNKHDSSDQDLRLTGILNSLFKEEKIEDYWFWYYSPMALKWSDHFHPLLTVYDCMDELSAFKFAPPQMIEMEKRLMKKADIVFTGGKSLYDAKKNQHHNIHCFPSSIDKLHFYKARLLQQDPPDQFNIPLPRLGFFGVIDERFDINLVGELASKKPEWQIILLGPVVKIEMESLPKNSNIHYLGMKKYDELPQYISNWDIAIMPFAINESTKYISPTKTPEYLAAGKPVVSTRITDVVHPYGEMGLVDIADTADQFIEMIQRQLSVKDAEWLDRVDDFLADISWDETWNRMNEIVEKSFLNNQIKPKKQYNVL